MSSSSTKTSNVCCLLFASLLKNNLIPLMANHDLPDKIIIIIIQILDVETTWLMGPFLRAGKRTFSLVHQTVALSKCNLWFMCRDPTNINTGGDVRNS